MAICSFCNKNTRLTKEHVYSASVLRIFDEVAPVTILGAKTFKSDLVIKDICEECNGKLGRYDEAMKYFTLDYLTEFKQLPWFLPESTELIELWVMKTVINIERIYGESEWWKDHIENLLLARVGQNVDILFGPWGDLSPDGTASVFNMLGAIEGRGAVILGATAGPWKHIQNLISACRVVKVGFGVFLFIAWREDIDIDYRASVLENLLAWHWAFLTAGNRIVGLPWNEHTCVILMQIADPARNIQEVMNEEDMF